MSTVLSCEVCAIKISGRGLRFCSKSCAQKSKRSHWLNKRLAPTAYPSVIDTAWAAGIFDGEGHPCRDHGCGTRATITQKARWIPDKMRNFFGGSVRRAWSSQRNRYYYIWGVFGKRARKFLVEIYPLMSPKRQKQIELAMVRGS